MSKMITKHNQNIQNDKLFLREDAKCKKRQISLAQEWCLILQTSFFMLHFASFCGWIDTNGVIKVLPPKTAEEILARERERKARITLLMALPEDHLAKFHKMTNTKEMWEAIKSRFGSNDESKKMQKYILKQQFEGFSVSNSEGLHKGYDRFQSLLSQLEIHGAAVSTEDAN
ncbi:hypothetical protein Tco_0780042 [Tanacetum coccineum]